ncbi:MAG: hypothetical protein C0402_13235 [Thermodesulfovibrio sp.]|nr:hypothetical protein [Thermodesulfovibrio sp.]
MQKALTIFIGFIHDFAAGCWAATVLAVYWLERSAGDAPQLGESLGKLQQEFFFIGLACIVVVFAAGAGRTFTYAHIGSVYGEDSEKLRRRMLIIKHVLLLIVFGAGTLWQYSIAFF